MEILANKITDYFVKIDGTREEIRDIYVYGLTAIFSYAINLSLTLLVGLTLGIPFEMLMFLIPFAVLRASSGGYHAKTWWGCVLASLFIVFAVSFLLLIDLDSASLPLTLALIIASAVLTFVLAPVAHSNRPLSKDDTIKFKKRARVTVIGFSITSLVLLIFGHLVFALCIALGLAVPTVSMLYVVIQQKKEVKRK